MASVTLTDNKNPCSHQPNIHDVVSTNMDDDGYFVCGGGGCTNIVTGQQLCATCLDNPPDDVEEECPCKQMPSDADSQMCRSCLRDHGDVFLGRKRQRPTKCAKADDPPPAKCAKVDDTTTYLAVPFTNDGCRDRFYMYPITPHQPLRAPVFSSQSESDAESDAESVDGENIVCRPLHPCDFQSDRTFRWSKNNEKSCSVDEFRQHFVSFPDGSLNRDTARDIMTAAEEICEQKAKEKLAWIVEEILHRNSSSVYDVLTQADPYYIPCFRRYFPFNKDSVQSVLNKLVQQCKVQSVKSVYSPKRSRNSCILPVAKEQGGRPIDTLFHGVHDARLCRRLV